MRYSPIILFCFLFSFILLNAQTSTITYQGKLLDASANPVTNSSLPMTFAIYTAETGGTKLWPSGAAAAKTVDVDLGLYTVVLGTGSGTDDAFTASVFSGGESWLEIVVDGSILPRTRLTTVPFAFMAGALEGKTWAEPGAIGATTPNTGRFTNLTVGNYSLPSADGNADEVLTTDGSGNVTWEALSTAPVSSVAESGTTPLTVSPTTGSVLITIAQSSAGSDGYLSSTDWNTFNNKSSSSTSISVTSPLTGGGDLSSDRTIGIQVANASQNGYLSSTDWTTFNSKSELALGETGTTAYRGDRGKSAYDERGSQIGGTGLNWDGSELDVSWDAPGNIGGTTPAAASFTEAYIGAYYLPSSDGVNGQVMTTNGSGTVTWETFSGAGWALTGNLGTTPGTHYMGTGDNNAFEMKVNDDRVARFEPDATSPNILMGSSSNSFSAVIHGAAILGGGSEEYWHEAGDNFTTICGGEYNWANGDYSFIGGGGANETDGWFATIAGGEMNYSSNTWSFVGGGTYNEADALAAAVVGGEMNSAYGEDSFIGGGALNTIDGDGSAILGGGGNYIESIAGAIGGGEDNYLLGFADGAFIGGGGGNVIDDGEASVICGGIDNTCSTSYSVIPGGTNNDVDGNYSFAFGEDVDVTNNYHTAFYDGINSGTFTINRESVSNGVFQIGTDATNGNGAYLSAGGVWTNGSSITFKDRFEDLNLFGILEKIKKLRLMGWFYRGTNEFHIWPFSEDFHEAFGTGDLSNPHSMSYLSGADVAGIGLAGVKALSKKVETLENENEELKTRLQILEEKLQMLIEEKK